MYTCAVGEVLLAVTLAERGEHFSSARPEIRRLSAISSLYQNSYFLAIFFNSVQICPCLLIYRSSLLEI